MVDAVVGDARAKASDKVAPEELKEQNDMQNTFYSNHNNEGQDPDQKITYGGVLENMGLGEKEEKPFWAKFLRNDYM